MINIILAGGGNAVDSKLLDELFVKLLKNQKILYIPIAWKTQNFTECHEKFAFGESLGHQKSICFSECKKWFSSTFSNYGVIDFEMWTDLKNKKEEDLKRFGGLYIGGGNTFSLLNDLRKSGFDKKLKQFLTENKPVYGGSAGAIIFGKNIKTASFGMDADENDVGLKDFSGFNVINDFCIQCHYEEKQDEELKQFSRNQKLIALSERSGLYKNNNSLKVIGFESAYVFEKGNKVEIKTGSFL